MLYRIIARNNSKFKWYPTFQTALVNRVVSTPTWPVPYYQRIVKAYPISEQQKDNLTQPDYPINYGDWYQTRQILSQTAKGRAIVEYAQANINKSTHFQQMNDCTQMAKAYTQDLLGYLDLANQQNKRILKTDLI